MKSVYYVKKFQGLYIVYLVVYQLLGETATGSRAMSPSARRQENVLPLNLKLQIPHYLCFLTETSLLINDRKKITESIAMHIGILLFNAEN